MSVFLIPATIAATIATLHVFAGGRDIARPLLRQNQLPPVVTLTHYYCWHLVTITLASLAIAYAYAAFAPDGYVLAVFATLYAGLFSLWGLALVLWKRQRHLQMPQWIMFAVLTASGSWALAS